ncbi:MAG TPA: molybdenum cofactor guanylyltransferase [Isosphaeraceae bacterium]|jgi:molybdopterin-guanine dinucleotide biosynthesis protein A|nr:molybdenum cofactor guanylyltransferase [Isosphaeraceae bacterium]
MKPGAVILCGGESRRMGRPKPWLPFGPERLLPRVVRLVSESAGPVVVVAAPGQDLPALPLEVAVVRDPVPGLGPLQGLAAGLEALPDAVAFAYATATDAPFLAPGWIDLLVSLIGPHDLAIPFVANRLHPLASLYRRPRAIDAIRQLLAKGTLHLSSLSSLLGSFRIPHDALRAVDPDLRTLINLNTPGDYHRALRDAGLLPPDPDDPRSA